MRNQHTAVWSSPGCCISYGFTSMPECPGIQVNLTEMPDSDDNNQTVIQILNFKKSILGDQMAEILERD